MSAYVEDTIYSGQLDHAQNEECQNRPRPVTPPEKNSKALPRRQADPLLSERTAAHEAHLSLHHREVEPPQRIDGGGLITTAHGPPRRLRQPRAAADQDDRHGHHHDERQPPGHAGLAQVDAAVAREVADADPYRGHELRQPREDTPTLGGRDLGNIDGHVAQEDALPQPRDRPPQQELREAVCRALEKRTDAKEYGAEQDGLEPPVVVCQPACEHGRDRAGEHYQGHREADERGGEGPDGGFELRHRYHGAD